MDAFVRLLGNQYGSIRTDVKGICCSQTNRIFSLKGSDDNVRHLMDNQCYHIIYREHNPKGSNGVIDIQLEWTADILKFPFWYFDRKRISLFIRKSHAMKVMRIIFF